MADEAAATGSPDLVALLEPYRNRALPILGNDLATSSWTFHDVPPDVVAAALSVVHPDLASGRPNGQPPATWLVQQGREHGGLLTGSVDTERRHLRIDGIQVVPPRARALAVAVHETWPASDPWPPALELAEAEAWPSRDSVEPSWTGLGTELLEHLPAGAVIGLWWD